MIKGFNIKTLRKFKFKEIITPIVVLSIWTIFLAISFWYNLVKVDESRETIVEVAAREMIKKDIVYRSWNASHGGVYVAVTKNTLPNKYLNKVKDRDITTTDGKEFTLMNPAWMTRLTMKRYKDLYGVESKITSLRPVNPSNVADEWEKKKLIIFDLNPKEKDLSEITINKNGEKVMRYIRPLITQKSCLKCHEDQGYRVGDIRGAISLSLKMNTFNENISESYYTLLFSHFIFWIVGLIGLGVGSVVFCGRRRALELNRAKLLKAKLRAERANFAKGQLLSSVSHEMRTPLSVIIGIADVLSENADSQNRSNISLLKRNALVLKKLVSDLLDMGRINIYSLQLKLTSVDLHLLIESVIASIDTINSNNDIQIRYIFESGIHSIRVVDELRLRQILTNLTNNALKFTERGMITVRLYCEGEGGQVIFEVEDTGIGIENRNIDKVFEPFEQEAAFLTHKRSGIGLGLFITKQLVELMGGIIILRSTKGVGTCFRISLDLPTAEKEVAMKPSGKGVPILISDEVPTSLNILLVDDSADIIELVKLFLMGTKHRLTTATNGKEATIENEKNNFDLILMDIQMPIMDGLTATKIIREQEKSKGEPPVEIWALTAHVDTDEVKGILSGGINRVIQKPVHKSKFRAELNEFSSKARYRQLF